MIRWIFDSLICSHCYISKYGKISLFVYDGRMITRKRVFVIICVAVLIVVLLLIMAYLSAVSQADYNNGYKIGLEAYTYGLPLLVTNTTFETMTSINISNGAFGPVNQFKTSAP